MATAFITIFACALMIIGLAVPLILGKVKRNRWYGFRTPSTLSSDHIWYPANRAMGWIMLVNGLCLAACVGAGMLGVPGFSLVLVLLYMPIATAITLGIGFYKLSRLK